MQPFKMRALGSGQWRCPGRFRVPDAVADIWLYGLSLGQRVVPKLRPIDARPLDVTAITPGTGFVFPRTLKGGSPTGHVASGSNTNWHFAARATGLTRQA